MNESISMLLPAISVLTIAFLINLPLGYIREGTPKFSFKWLLWIHASIPVLIYLRYSLEITPWIIPFSIGSAVWGQTIGGSWRKVRKSKDERDKLEQIPVLQYPPAEALDREVVVCLLNMGGPKTNDDVKDFQKCLFEDPLLIRFPLSFLLQKFFAWILITFRLKAVKERYQMIGGGSPIYRSTEAQVNALQEELKKRNRDIRVTYSFNYSPPFPKDTMKEIRSMNGKYILPLSLYPHFSKATTGSNVFYLKQAAKKDFPELRFIDAPPYYLHEGYIQAFVDRIHGELKAGESLEDFYLLFSAHGLPLYFLTEGDPYPFQISQTVASILSKLRRSDRWVLAYQSAVGPLQWLKPSTDEIIRELGEQRIGKVLVVPVSFVGDHIETICEIDMEYREAAHKQGIHDFRMAKALETHPGFISALGDTVESVVLRKGSIKEQLIPAHSRSK